MVSLICVIALSGMCIWLSDQNRKLKDELAEQLYINRVFSIESVARDLEDNEPLVSEDEML